MPGIIDSQDIKNKMAEFYDNWISARIKNIDENLFQKINQTNPNKNYSKILIQLLVNRNIASEEEINNFLNPSIKFLRQPDLLPNILEAVKRLKKAIEKKETILVFGDYDADGVISSVLIYNFLKKIGLEVEIYIPDRFEEGYDINLNFLKKIAKEKKYSLIICVDCGTNCVDVREFILSDKCSIEIIACDHHEQCEKNEIKQSYKYIIVNPKLEGSEYPFKYLSGAGVTFKLIIALLRQLNEKIKEKFEKNYLSSLLDLVAIATIADIMPLIDENRIIVKNGLKLIKDTKNSGLKRLVEIVLNNKNEISVHDVGFIIAPRLNAAGRIKNAMNSVNLLRDDAGSFEDIITELDSFNRSRQSIQEKIFTEILESNDFEAIVKEKKFFIEKSPDWNEGVLGVVASDIIKKFNIPVILFKEIEGNKLKGSGRSIEKFDLYSNLKKLEKYFIKFGGHKLACGITMKSEYFEEFREQMMQIALNLISKKDIAKKLTYDLELSFKDLNFNLMNELEMLEPHGIGNPRPVFLTRDCFIEVVNFYSTSKGNRYAVMKVKNKNVKLDAVFFNIEDKIGEKAYDKLKNGASIDILFNIEGKKSLARNLSIRLVIQSLHFN
jgi:single-stranded-DNA-specific exonuclease